MRLRRVPGKIAGEVLEGSGPGDDKRQGSGGQRVLAQLAGAVP